MKFVGGDQANNFTYVEDREETQKKNLKQSKVLLKKSLGEKYLKRS